MRTTIEVNDELLRAVKVYAAGERMTLKAAFEQALRQFLAGPAAARGDAPPIPVFHGRGVQRGVDLTDSAALRNIMDAEP
ncbi:MAG: type II toxin-antitoxin system VapB family antitoxin [bacterium]|nr:type II toxin-antitoxin system VapB family antitoxin [bacterium]